MEVRYLLLTHGHYDHTTAVPALHRVYPQADIYIHQADANGAGSTLFPLAGEVDDLKLYDEGDVIRLGDHEIQVLHTPGHSPGSVTYRVGTPCSPAPAAAPTCGGAAMSRSCSP